MKIYVLLNQKNNGFDTVCVSEDINKIRTSICEDFHPDKDYPKLEIWENDECIYHTTGNKDLIRKIADEITDTAQNFNIRKIAYDLYKQQWIDTHSTEAMRLDAIREYHKDRKECIDNKMEINPYEEWLTDVSFNGLIYACYEEFCNNEYLDEGYMISLLKDEILIKYYIKDINENKE